MTTINQKIFDLKVQTWINAELKQYHVFVDSHEFAEFTESGFMKYLINNYDHNIKCGGDCFCFDLLKPLKEI